MILSSAWDNGDADEVRAAEADPLVYSDAVCTRDCRESIRRIGARLEKTCTVRTDRFDFANYGHDGKAYLDKGRIEEGPVHVAKSLLERYDRLCARPPIRREKTEWKTCAADIWMKWGIVDGKNEAHMNGLEQFMEQTSVKRVIPSELRTVNVLSSFGTNMTYTFHVRSRRVGPGVGETDCNFCTLDWLERKMRSFEFGLILDPVTGEALGLTEFRAKLESAIRRCSNNGGRWLLSRVDQKWTEFGWWCDGKPCNLDKPAFSEATMVILHGWKEDSSPLRTLRRAMEYKDAPKKALQALHDGMKDMPCGIGGFDESIAQHEIIPHEHIVRRLCSDECRNALDRLQQQHGILFAGHANDRKYGHFFQFPEKAAEQIEKVCLSSTPNSILQPSQNLCAPGYAAVGHPEWIFESPSSRPAILAAFSAEIDALAARLPRKTITPNKDPESVRIQSKKLSQSACNTCAGDIFIGSDPNWKKTVHEYLDDINVNGTEYVAAAKKGWLTCGKMYGYHFSDYQKKMMWKKFGLDRYD